MPASIYKADFHPVDFVKLSSEGLSNLQIAAKWGMNVKTIQRWAKDLSKPEFMEAFEVGQQREEAAWEGLGWEIANGKLKGNGLVFIYNMKCRFGGKWLQDGKHNKLEITTKHQNMTDEELNKIIKFHIAKEPVAIEYEQPINLIDLKQEQYSVITGSGNPL